MTLQERADIYRIEVINMYCKAGRGHLVSTLSCMDIFTALYFGDIMRDEDILIVSKGHANGGLYPILRDKGLLTQEDIDNYCQAGGKLRMHADPSIPGIHFLGGSLGNGIGYTIGRAIDDRNTNIKRHYYVVVGDAEMYEGSNWEALFMLSDLPITIIVDDNSLGILGEPEDLTPEFNLRGKLEEYADDYVDVICQGHHINDLAEYINPEGSNNRRTRIVICCNTKGKGVSFMENDRLWHTKLPNEEQRQQAIDEIRERHGLEAT